LQERTCALFFSPCKKNDFFSRYNGRPVRGVIGDLVKTLEIVDVDEDVEPVSDRPILASQVAAAYFTNLVEGSTNGRETQRSPLFSKF
jgi:hypothetical protein